MVLVQNWFINFCLLKNLYTYQDILHSFKHHIRGGLLLKNMNQILFLVSSTERKHNDGLYVLTHKTVFENENRIRVIWQCLSLSCEETWEINIAKKEFSNTVLWVWRVLAYFCRKNEDLTENFVLLAFMSVIHLFI